MMETEEQYFEAQREQEYFEQMQLDNELHQAADFLLRNGWMVIPKEKIGDFLGNYVLVPVTPVKQDLDPNDMPF
jgi:hypothetical protein